MIKWLAHPENTAAREEIVEDCEDMWDLASSPWERKFLNSIIEQQGKMSPLQEEIYERLVKTYLRGQPSPSDQRGA